MKVTLNSLAGGACEKLHWLALCMLLNGGSAPAATRYVWQESPNPGPPHTTWASAAHTIQEAVDSAVVGDEILVTNGVYQTGAGEVYGMSNRVAVSKPVSVRSVNGPASTHIVGYQMPGTTNGPAAVRCVYLTNDAVLSGFTLTNGATQASGYYDSTNECGGGVWCEGISTVVSNCVLAGNSADHYGGGAYGGTLNNCVLTGNSAGRSGGGASSDILNHCVLIGNSAESGGGASRCNLNDCALTRNAAYEQGGGASSSTLNNCTLTGNSAYEYGGGAYEGTLNFCTISSNWAGEGGGAYDSTVSQCALNGNYAEQGGGVFECVVRQSTITGNWAEFAGGGVYGSWLDNCIVYYNTARSGLGHNHDGYSELNYCCTAPLPYFGEGNITREPQLATASHLSAASPCLRAGSSVYAHGTDIDGEAWSNPPSMGCDEYRAGEATGELIVGLGIVSTNVAVGYAVDVRALIEGPASASAWDFGDGVVVSNRPYASHAWTAPAIYSVVLRAWNDRYPSSVSTTVPVQVVETPVHYVAAESAAPVWPFTTWDTAAATIQDAIDATAIPGALVLVSNGVYATGGRTVNGSLTNRVVVDKPVIVRSLNGPEVTVIEGYQVPGTTNWDGAIRCVYLTNGAILSGFTLTKGATLAVGDIAKELSGGGISCESIGAVVTNCTIIGNSAEYYGGGAYQGALINCTLTENIARYGGGAGSGTVVNCLLNSNSADDGGGASGSTLNHCTVTKNSSKFLNGGGVFDCIVNNSIVYDNNSNAGPFANCMNSYLTYCCAMPLPSGFGCITNAPLFVDSANGNWRLQPNSPCVNSGVNDEAHGSTDLDGNPRIVSGTADMGAYEFQGAGSTISYAWLQRKRLS